MRHICVPILLAFTAGSLVILTLTSEVLTHQNVLIVSHIYLAAALVVGALWRK